MKNMYKIWGVLFSLLSVSFFWGCSEENEQEFVSDPEPLNKPCTITIDLNDPDSRLAFHYDKNVLKSSWSKGDKFEIYKNNVCYTFTLDEGCEGSSLGTFTSPATPPQTELKSDYSNYGAWYSGNFNFDVYFPSKDEYENLSFENPVQKGDGDMSHLKDKITMKHTVGHYTNVRFTDKDYTTGVEFPNFFSPYKVQTYGAYFFKNTIFKINATNLPVDLQPVSLTLESISDKNLIVPFMSPNLSDNSSKYNKAEMTLQNFDKDRSFVAYMATSVHQKTFPAGSILRLTVTDKDGEIYVSDKYFDWDKTVAGGKLLTLNYNGGWKKGNNPNYVSKDKSKDGTYVQLQAASVDNGINIVFMGDGYSDRQIEDGTYDKAMKDGYDAFFSEEPFVSFKEYFNVYYVVAVSDREGCSDNAVAGSPNNSAFKTYFGDGTHVGGNDAAVLAYTRKIPALQNINEDNLTSIVMMNSPKYAGTCYMTLAGSNQADYGQGYSISYFPVGNSYEALRQVLNHEANGHGFGKLGDEYSSGGNASCTLDNLKNKYNPRGWHLNIDNVSDPAQTIWSEFYQGDYKTYEQIGAYAGAYTWPATHSTVFYRPTTNSIMNQNTGNFNAPSRKAIYVRIHKMVYGEDWNWEDNKETFFNWDRNNIFDTYSLRSVYSRAGNQNHIPLAPPVIIFK